MSLKFSRLSKGLSVIRLISNFGHDLHVADHVRRVDDKDRTCQEPKFLDKQPVGMSEGCVPMIREDPEFLDAGAGAKSESLTSVRSLSRAVNTGALSPTFTSLPTKVNGFPANVTIPFLSIMLPLVGVLRHDFLGLHVTILMGRRNLPG